MGGIPFPAGYLVYFYGELFTGFPSSNDCMVQYKQTVTA